MPPERCYAVARGKWGEEIQKSRTTSFLSLFFGCPGRPAVVFFLDIPPLSQPMCGPACLHSILQQGSFHSRSWPWRRLTVRGRPGLIPSLCTSHRRIIVQLVRCISMNPGFQIFSLFFGFTSGPGFPPEKGSVLIPIKLSLLEMQLDHLGRCLEHEDVPTCTD
jgi:hypothetical protein